MTTVAQAHRQLVGEMFAEGVDVEEIARRVGISVDRVDAILDQLDGVEHQDDAHRAPAVEPVRPEPRPLTDDRQPIIVGSKARVVPSVPPKPVEVRPVPDLSVTTSDLVMTDAQRAEIESLRAELAAPSPCGEKEGTYAGYQWHAHNNSPICARCRAARSAYEKDLRDRKRAERENLRPAKGLMQVISDTALPDVKANLAANARANARPYDAGGLLEPGAAAVQSPAEAVLTPAGKTGPRPCGTQAAYKRHLRHGEKPCGACVAAHSEYMRSYRDRPVLDKPEGAVALLTLPISVPHLIAVSDALELAYGPGLRIVGADGGFWVLGRAS